MKVNAEVPRPPELLTVSVTGALMPVIAVWPNSPLRLAFRFGPLVTVPDRVAVSLCFTPETVALAVIVAVRDVAVSEAGTSRISVIVLQLEAGMVVPETWSSVTTKSAWFAPVLVKLAPVAGLAAELQTLNVIGTVPTVPSATAEKVKADGVM